MVVVYGSCEVGLILIGMDESRLGRARLDEALDGDPFLCVAGGHDAGGNELLPLDEASLMAFVERNDAQVEAWAVCALFATRNADHERRAHQLIVDATGKPTSLGHVLSAGLDAPRRALTAVLNARLIPLIGELLTAAQALLAVRGIAAPLMVVKGDGSLIAAEVARSSPVETILSGPAASLVGARALCDQQDLMVADTGGTTTDIARLVKGAPRLAADGATVGGWRTMVRAVKVSTVALGGDGELSLASTKGRPWRLGARRAIPLSLLVERFPAALEVLRAQAVAPTAGPYDGRFAVVQRRPTPAALARLGAPARELLDRISGGPVAVADLFSERSRDRALDRLERAGLVQIAAFTPSDASQLAGTYSGWNREGAQLGASLLIRGVGSQGLASEDERFTSVEHLAQSACRFVAEQVALAVTDAVFAEVRSARNRVSDGEDSGLTPSQRAMVEEGFRTSTRAAPASDDLTNRRGPDTPLLNVQVNIGLPLVGLGAPARSYHAQAAEMLNTPVLLPEHGHVANALGAVAGLIRQVVEVTIVAAGGIQAKALLSDGPVTCETVDAAVALAEADARATAVAQACAAGVSAADVVVQMSREDDAVERDGLRVFLESRVTAVASGRPASG